MATNNAANFGTGTSGQVLTSNGEGAAPTFQAAPGGLGAGSVAVGGGERLQSTGTGTQAITGLGFQPRAICIWSVAQMSGANGGGSWGSSESGIAEASVYWGQAGSAGGTAARDASNIIHSMQGNTTAGVANIQSYDSDGFTLNWTTMAVTTHFQFIAFK